MKHLGFLKERNWKSNESINKKDGNGKEKDSKAKMVESSR